MKATCRSLDLFWMPTPDLLFVPNARTSVPRYRVGEPFQRGRRGWPRGTQYHYAAHGHELTVFQPGLDDETVQDVKRGQAEFALVVREPILLLAYRFGDAGVWADTPYCWHMHPPHTRLIPPDETSNESRALLWITLVGADDGIIHAQRGVTLAPDFTRVLHDALRRQAHGGFRSDDCVAALSDLLVHHPSTADRLALACSKTIGNR